MKHILIGVTAFLLITTAMGSAFAATKKVAPVSPPKKEAKYAEGSFMYALIKTPEALSYRFNENVRFGVVPAKKQQVAMKISF